MLLCTCEIKLMLTWLANFIICKAHRVENFAITDGKFYVPVVTLSTQDMIKETQQFKTEFKRTI